MRKEICFGFLLFSFLNTYSMEYYLKELVWTFKSHVNIKYRVNKPIGLKQNPDKGDDISIEEKEDKILVTGNNLQINEIYNFNEIIKDGRRIVLQHCPDLGMPATATAFRYGRLRVGGINVLSGDNNEPLTEITFLEPLGEVFKGLLGILVKKNELELD